MCRIWALEMAGKRLVQSQFWAWGKPDLGLESVVPSRIWARGKPKMGMGFCFFDGRHLTTRIGVTRDWPLMPRGF